MKIPFVHNVRRGLATNSSSSHSLVYFNESRPNHESKDFSGVDTQFGWDNFRLTTLGEKLLYAMTSILSSGGLNAHWREENTESFEKLKASYPNIDKMLEAAAAGYIDHQSVTSPDRLINAALDPTVEIWGGNDNGGSPFETDDDWRPIPPPGAIKIVELG